MTLVTYYDRAGASIGTLRQPGTLDECVAALMNGRHDLRLLSATRRGGWVKIVRETYYGGFAPVYTIASEED